MKISISGSNLSSLEHPVQKSWIFSRPNEVDSDLNQVKKLDLPVNEFLVLNLEIESTILEREIFVTMRNHVIWAQTSRVQNILEFDVDENIKSKINEEHFEKVRSEMIALSKTERQDDYRLKLPLFSLTKFSTSISIRSLINLMNYFLYLSEKKNMSCFKESYFSIKDIVSQYGYYENHYSSWKVQKILSEDFKTGSQASVCGNFMTVQTRIPMYLRAQLARHRGLDIVDNLFTSIDSSICQKDLSMEVDVQVSGRIEVFQEVAGKRACWIAQYNIWSDFLNKVTQIIPEMKLPCSGGGCPYSRDAFLRYENKDPNPPCPIHCSKNSLPVSLDMREKMYSMIKSDNRDTLYWGDFVRATTLENK